MKKKKWKTKFKMKHIKISSVYFWYCDIYYLLLFQISFLYRQISNCWCANQHVETYIGFSILSFK